MGNTLATAPLASKPLHHAPKVETVESITPSQPQAPPLQSHRSRLLWLLAIAVAFAAGWALASGTFRPGEKETLPPEAATAERDPAAVMVTVEPVTFRSVQRVVEGVGTLHGYEEVTISAKVEGRVQKIHQDVADVVKPGELLMEIDPIDNELAVQQAERSLQVELAKLGLTEPAHKNLDLKTLPTVQQAQARLVNAKSKLLRAESLANSRAISAEELSNFRADFGVQEAEFANQLLMAKTGLATIQMKQSALKMAQQQLKDTRVLVPTPTRPVPGSADGASYAVTHRTVAEGTLVRPGTEVYKLVINQTLKLKVPVPERYSTEVKVGQKADVHTAAFARPFAGLVTRINPAVEATTRTFEVEIQIPNPDGELKPGSFAKAVIHSRVDANAATAPIAAIVNFAGINKVFLAENGLAKVVEITLGAQTGEWVEIRSPAITRDAQIITSGQSVLVPGAPVSVRPERK